MQVALIQMAVTDFQNRQERFQKIEQFLEEIERDREKKPDLIVFPELWGCGFQNFSGYMDAAERLEGETWQVMSGWAKRLNCWIHSGSFVEKCAGEKRADEKSTDGNRENYYNTSLLFDRTGQNRGIYRKIHLFGFESMEQKLLTGGKEVVAVDTEFGRAGMTTCYDLRFPEQFRLVTDPVPAFFLVTAAWPDARLAHSRLFQQTRAVENQCYVISCNAAGTQCGVKGAGHSMITDPWGAVLAEGSEDEAVIWCDLDLNRVEECRSQFPALEDRVELSLKEDSGEFSVKEDRGELSAKEGYQE